MFSAITSNYRGRPLTSHQFIVKLISATRNTKGLTIGAELDTNAHPLGIKVSNTEMAEAYPLVLLLVARKPPF